MLMNIGHGRLLDGGRVVMILSWDARSRRAWRKAKRNDLAEDAVAWNGTARSLMVLEGSPRLYVRCTLTPRTLRKRIDAQRTSTNC